MNKIMSEKDMSHFPMVPINAVIKLIHQILVLKINSTKIKTKYLNADAVQNRWMKTMMLLEATSGIEMEI